MSLSSEIKLICVCFRYTYCIFFIHSSLLLFVVVTVFHFSFSLYFLSTPSSDLSVSSCRRGFWSPGPCAVHTPLLPALRPLQRLAWTSTGRVSCTCGAIQIATGPGGVHVVQSRHVSWVMSTLEYIYIYQ